MCKPIHGGIYFFNLPQKEGSSVQGGLRPVVIVSNDLACRYSPVLNVVALTSQMRKKALPTHVHLDSNCLSRQSIALCEQILIVDTNELKSTANQIGILSDDEMSQIQKGLKISLGIE